MSLKPLQIGDLTVPVPIIQGGMGVGISLHRLAGNVAKEGGIGIISTAQCGFPLDNFKTDTLQSNLDAIEKEFKAAKEIAGDGIVGFNIMVASFSYEEIVKQCVKVGADVIISGAGLPTSLPEYVAGSKAKIAPIISSGRAAKILLKHWSKHYNRTADFIVIEGPLAGGHLGFKKDHLQEAIETMDEEVTKIIAVVKDFEEEFNVHIPVIFAGGVFNRSDIDHYMGLGCEGVQMATRFVCTEECDAPDDYKERYLNAKKEDVEIITSPVGMPGRAIKNKFSELTKTHNIPTSKCNRCLDKKLCDSKTNPYCISTALINAVTHHTDDAILFAGANVYRVNEMTTVHELMKELCD
ncbi:MAG: nitronate monooxygenase [Lachnospiraceae bacterium]|nr:nitronate monooxygenase [Lachnospiraceae bacterium]